MSEKVNLRSERDIAADFCNSSLASLPGAAAAMDRFCLAAGKPYTAREAIALIQTAFQVVSSSHVLIALSILLPPGPVLKDAVNNVPE